MVTGKHIIVLKVSIYGLTLFKQESLAVTSLFYSGNNIPKWLVI